MNDASNNSPVPRTPAADTGDTSLAEDSRPKLVPVEATPRGEKFKNDLAPAFHNGWNLGIEAAALVIEKEFNGPNTSKYYGDVVRALKRTPVLSLAPLPTKDQQWFCMHMAPRDGTRIMSRRFGITRHIEFLNYWIPEKKQWYVVGMDEWRPVL